MEKFIKLTMKKENTYQRSIYLTERHWKILKQKAKDEGFSGKGSTERYIEKVCEYTIIFVKGEGEITISVK